MTQQEAGLTHNDVKKPVMVSHGGLGSLRYLICRSWMSLVSTSTSILTRLMYLTMNSRETVWTPDLLATGSTSSGNNSRTGRSPYLAMLSDGSKRIQYECAQEGLAFKE